MLTGESAASLGAAAVAEHAWRGLETTIALPASLSGQLVAVRALDRGGATLATSDPLTV